MTTDAILTTETNETQTPLKAPWRRFFARSLDLGLLATLLNLCLSFVFPFFSNEGKQFLFRMDASGNLSLLAVSLPFRAAVSFQMGQNSRQMALWAFRSSEG